MIISGLKPQGGPMASWHAKENTAVISWIGKIKNMKKKVKIILVVVGLLFVGTAWVAYQYSAAIEKVSSEDPLVWAPDIAALEAKTKGIDGSGEAIIFIGSSSIRFWQTLAQDMEPMLVIQHGFGGAKLNDVVHYSGRLVNAYRPRAVVLFAGTNDINLKNSKSPQTLLASYQDFVAKVRLDQPQLPVFYLAITPSMLRWEVWSIAQETNRLISDWSAGEDTLYFIDTSAALLGEDGTPYKENYRWDGLHLSGEGYQIWSEIIRARLLQDLGDIAVEQQR
ncbi:MAG: lysophospholipase L1-like esterase [Halioglobus sp.]|jgi:lysophospholipase L1-like esterase